MVRGGGAFATRAALQRRAKRRRAARAFKRRVFEVWSQTGMTWAEAAAWVADPGNETMCEVCGWTYNMVCPECSLGCACEGNCSGWRHSEYEFDDGWDADYADRTECEGCGAGHEYHCVCYQRTADEVDGEPERDYWQEYKDDQMQPPMEEPPDGYYDGVGW